jgi:VIT1/CCC1 family predicted Fe2+/Mn2+ transporter
MNWKLIAVLGIFYSGMALGEVDDKYFEMRLAEMEKRYEQRFLAQEQAVKSALASAEKAVDAALQSAETAKEVARINDDKWMANANEWRKAMDDRERNFLSTGMGYVIGGLTLLSLLFILFKEFSIRKK